MSKEILFIALLFPPKVAKVATQLKQFFADNFQSKKALNSPPHITLQAPFKYHADDKPQLINFLTEFACNHSLIPISLDNFGCFKPRVIYINVEQTAELMAIQDKLKIEFQNKLNIQDERYGDRPYHPHATIAFKDLTTANFHRAWPEFEGRSLHYKFTVPELTLLRHDGRCWQIDHHFSLTKNP